MMDLPDWRDRNQYPDPRTVGNQRLAWEFLRRNPAYVEDWGSFVAAMRLAAGDDADLSRYVDCHIRKADADARWLASIGIPGMNELSSRLHDHPALTFIEQFDDRHQSRTPLDRHLAKRWGISSLRSPNGSAFMELQSFDGDRWGTELTSSGLGRLEAEHDGYLKLRHSKWLILQINLSLPLNVLEERTMWMIRGAQKYRAKAGHIEPIKHHSRPPKLLVEYLRILDARGASKPVPYSEIGAVLRPREPNHPPEYTRNHRLRAAHREATRMRDDGYRVLPLLRDPNVKRSAR